MPMPTFDQVKELHITGLSKDDIHAEFAKHHAGIKPSECNYLSGMARKGEPVKWKRTHYDNRTVQTFIVQAVKVGRVHQYTLDVTSEVFDKNPWPKPVVLSALGTCKANQIVHCGVVKHDVGIGWVDECDAEERHYYEYPTVEGN